MAHRAHFVEAANGHLQRCGLMFRQRVGQGTEIDAPQRVGAFIEQVIDARYTDRCEYLFGVLLSMRDERYVGSLIRSIVELGELGEQALVVVARQKLVDLDR